jgi:NADPH2:quinone reductase
MSCVRAIVMSKFGGPEVLVEREVDEPVIGHGGALIDVELVNVTFVETQLRAGLAPRASMLPALPAIPGNGVGGVVAAVGPGVDSALVGTRVVASTGGSGAYAERVVVAAEQLIGVPDQVALADAVALLSDGRTAIALIGRAALEPGETVLVEAAGGGVGSLLVQLAKAAGARVIAVAGAERKLRLARELGAEVAIDYTRASWPSEVVAAARAAPALRVCDRSTSCSTASAETSAGRRSSSSAPAGATTASAWPAAASRRSTKTMRTLAA